MSWPEAEVQAGPPILNGLGPMGLEGWPVDAAEGLEVSSCTVALVEEKEEEEEVLAELQQREGPGSMEMLLLVSGAYTHVCPPSFAPQIAITHQRPRAGGLTD